MKRELTAREKGLLLFLAILVIALGYFKLIFEPIDQQVKDYRANTEQEQTLLDTELVRLAQMNKMKETVERIRASGEEKAIPAYDNSGVLLRELDRTLAAADDYTLEFSAQKSRDGYIILRPVSMSFQTGTYQQARAILDALCASDNINQISDLTISDTTVRGVRLVRTDLVITYFEVAP